jgi:hypothetical protein
MSAPSWCETRSDPAGRDPKGPADDGEADLERGVVRATGRETSSSSVVVRHRVVVVVLGRGAEAEEEAEDEVVVRES